VTVAAIDAVVGDVMLVAERDGLLFDYLDVRDVVTTVHHVGKSEQSPGSDNSGGEADLRNAICASVEELGHPVFESC
jgi:hypothetical protein